MWSLCVAIALIGVSPGTRVHGTVAGGEIRRYRFDLPPDQFFTAAVDQGKVDLVVTLVAPDGRRVVHDARERGVELVGFPTAAGGVYELRIQTSANDARRAPYELSVDHTRMPSSNDDRFVEAQRLATEARQFYKRRDRDSLQQAVALRRRLVPLWDGLDQPAMAVAALVGTGDALYRLNAYDEADGPYRDALIRSRALGDRRSEAEILNNLAMAVSPRGDVADALTLLQQSVDVWRTIGFRSGEAIAANNRAILLRQAGEYDEARQQYGRALSIFRSLGDHRGEAFAANNMALVLESLGKPGQALVHLESAASAFGRIGERLARARALITAARILLGQGRRAASLANATQGLAIAEATGDSLLESEGREQLARIRAASGEHAAARSEYARALALARAAGSRRGESTALHGMGAESMATGDITGAVDLFTQALDIRQSVGLQSLVVESHVALARARRAAGAIDAARTHLESALALAEQLRARVFERELRTSFFGSFERYYTDYLDVLFELGQSRPGAGFDAMAFEAAERAKARLLTERLRDLATPVARTGRDVELETRERGLRQSLDFWALQLWQQADKPASPEREGLINAKLAELIEAHGAAEADVSRARGRQVDLFAPAPMTIASLRSGGIDANVVLVEYALGPSRSYVWAVMSDAVVMAALPGRADIERKARLFYQAVSTRDVAAANTTASLQHQAAALSHLLLDPVASALHRDRVVIVADGALAYVPFGALPAPGGSVPLSSLHDMVAAPSAATLVLLQRQSAGRPHGQKGLAVFADPVFAASDPRVRPMRPSPVANRSSGLQRLSRLPYSRQEADRIVALSPSADNLKATDFDASRAAVTDGDLAQYRFLHFATHAIVNEEHPDLSGIVLSLVDRQGLPVDGFLRMQDLEHLRLRADLVVVSACETAIGPEVTGEGVMSLARGFFRSGVPRVVAALWKIDDEASAALLERFYRHLFMSPGVSPAAALREAQAEMRASRRWSHPYYWSGVVVMGVF